MCQTYHPRVSSKLIFKVRFAPCNDSEGFLRRIQEDHFAAPSRGSLLPPRRLYWDAVKATHLIGS